MAVAALALVKLAHWGAAYACCAVLIGNTVSEAVSCGIMALFARQEPSFRPCADDPPRGYTSRELWEIVLPVTGSRLVASVLQAGESVLIPACLATYLGTRAEAVAQYGSLKGMALPLIFFPFSVLAALSGLLMPEITRAHTARDTAALRRLVRLAMGLTGGVSLLVGAALVLFGKDAAILLYHDAQAGRYVQVLGFVAPFMYLESMVDAILKGMGEQLATFRYSVLDSILRIAGILWHLGIDYAYAGENIAMGQRTPEIVMNDWMNSSGHRANILNENFDYIGVGYTMVDGHPYWVQLFTGDFDW